jgi:hypothetical protein
MNKPGFNKSIDQFCTTVFGRRVLSPAKYGRFEISHTNFKSTKCYSIRSEKLSTLSEFRLLKNGGGWYREGKSEILIPWTDIDAANTLISESCKDVFARHSDIHIGNLKEIGDFHLKP